jgi:hypothetical protein
MGSEGEAAMSNLLVIFTVVFVLTIAAACGVGVLVMLGGVKGVEDPPWRKRKAAAMRAAGTHHVFKDLQ